MMRHYPSNSGLKFHLNWSIKLFGCMKRLHNFAIAYAFSGKAKV